MQQIVPCFEVLIWSPLDQMLDPSRSMRTNMAARVVINLRVCGFMAARGWGDALSDKIRQFFIGSNKAEKQDAKCAFLQRIANRAVRDFDLQTFLAS